MNNLESIVIGIVSGIITSACVYLLILVFQRIVLPWYRQLIYRGIDIQGQWKCSRVVKSKITEEYNIELSQKADCVSGNITVTKLQQGKPIITENKILSGNLKDRFLYAFFLPAKKSRLGISSILLEIVGDGSEMIGNMIFYDIGAKRIMSDNIVFERVDRVKFR